MARLSALAACALVLVSGSARSQPAAAPAPRSEVPIHDVVLSDGVHRYGVPVTIGSAQLMAGLDTGAAGLRLLPDAGSQGQAQAGWQPETYSFGTGTQLDGTVGRAQLRIGDLAGPASVHLVNKTGCSPVAPRCPGSLGDRYGFLGNGLPGEGFRVLLGGNMGPTSIDNPLQAVGARRWIIELPRPGEASPGRLILNPTDEEVAGFTPIPLMGGFSERGGGGLHDAVAGCLRNEATGARACGPTALDTGAHVVRLLNGRIGQTPWPTGTPMALQFLDARRAPVATTQMIVGGPSQGLVFGSAPRPETILQPGMAPYYAYAVLYDPGRRRLGLKARPPVAGSPRAEPAAR